MGSTQEGGVELMNTDPSLGVKDQTKKQQQEKEEKDLGSPEACALY
jgi:hypothetical protein